MNNLMISLPGDSSTAVYQVGVCTTSSADLITKYCHNPSFTTGVDLYNQFSQVSIHTFY